LFVNVNDLNLLGRCIEEGGPMAFCVEYDLGLFNIFVPLDPLISILGHEYQEACPVNGKITDETTVNLLAFKAWRDVGLRLDDRESQRLGLKNIGRTQSLSHEWKPPQRWLRAGDFLGRAGVFNLGLIVVVI